MSLRGYGQNPNSKTMQVIALTAQIGSNIDELEKMALVDPKSFSYIADFCKEHSIKAPYGPWIYEIIAACAKHISPDNKKSSATLYTRASDLIHAWTMYLSLEPIPTLDKVEKFWQLLFEALQAPNECWPGFISGQNMIEQLESICEKHRALK